MAFINSLNYILPSRSACIPRDTIKVNRPSPGISKAVLGTAGLQGGGGGGSRGGGGRGGGRGRHVYLVACLPCEIQNLTNHFHFFISTGNLAKDFFLSRRPALTPPTCPFSYHGREVHFLNFTLLESNFQGIRSGFATLISFHFRYQT